MNIGDNVKTGEIYVPNTNKIAKMGVEGTTTQENPMPNIPPTPINNANPDVVIDEDIKGGDESDEY